MISLSVINTREPTDVMGLWMFIAEKKGRKSTFYFNELKQDVEKVIQNVMKKPQYLVFFVLTSQEASVILIKL